MRLVIGALALALTGCGKPAAPVAQPTPEPAPTPPRGTSLSREDIERPIQEHKAAVLACYQRELARDKELGGKVVVHFVIDGAGVVSEASVVREQSTMDDEVVETCVLDEFRSIRFPAGGGGVVNYPLIFSSPD